jgi:4-amino-4-deoxy-L-arabinose transferase-like glycosyltransferase
MKLLKSMAISGDLSDVAIFGKIRSFIHRIPGPLFLLLTLILPMTTFLFSRILRMAGDEKVYVAQAIEMSRRGSWFIQTLAEIPYYYKGPFHYWLIRIGLIIFGNSIAASIWMNFLWLGILVVLAYYAFRKFYDDDKAILLSAVLTFHVGTLSHAFASQMEVEVHFFYSLVFLSLLALPRKLQLWTFWILTGMAGWVKSPFHSVLIGLSAAVFWIWEGDIKNKMKSLDFWLAPIAGIVICVLGYLPILLNDFEAFWASFILTEHLGRPNNYGGIRKTTLPLVHYSLPWLTIGIATLFYRLKRFRLNGMNSFLNISRITKLGLSLSVPTIVYWAFSSYQGQNYSMPALSVFLVAVFSGTEVVRRGERYGARWIGLSALLIGVALFAIRLRFSPFPEWWPKTEFMFSLLSILLFAIFFIWVYSARTLLVGCMGMIFAFLSISKPIGERELDGLRLFQIRYPNAKMLYYNPSKIIFAEWGMLQLATGKDFWIAQDFKSLESRLSEENGIVVPDAASLDDLRTELKERNIPFEITRWKKWWSKGRSSTGEPVWIKAWQEADLSFMEKDVYIVYVKNKK